MCQGGTYNLLLISATPRKVVWFVRLISVSCELRALLPWLQIEMEGNAFLYGLIVWITSILGEYIVTMVTVWFSSFPLQALDVVSIIVWYPGSCDPSLGRIVVVISS